MGFELTPKQREASDALLRRGSVRHLLHAGQRIVYDFLVNNPKVLSTFCYSCRKYGKSFMLALFAIEHCLRRDLAIVKHIFPSFKLSKETMFPIMQEIFQVLPDDLRPELRRSEAAWYWQHNGSQYRLGGSDPQTIDNNRGPYASLILLDEVCFFDANIYEELLYSVLFPQMSLIPDAKVIYASTPPSNPQHPVLMKTMPAIRRNGGFFQFTIYDNPLLDKAQIEIIKERCGGEESNAWKREYLAEIVTDDSRRVFPEWDTKKYVTDAPFEYYDKVMELNRAYQGFIVVDCGVVDLTAAIAFVYDHLNNKLIAIGEWSKPAANLETIVTAIKDLRDTYLPWVTHYDCMIDAFEQTKLELRTTYNLSFRSPLKAKVEDQVTLTRNAILHDKIRIHRRCTKLIASLEGGVWKQTEKNKDFERLPELGHLDFGAALNYAVKFCPWGIFPGQRGHDKIRLGRRRHI